MLLSCTAEEALRLGDLLLAAIAEEGLILRMSHRRESIGRSASIAR